MTLQIVRAERADRLADELSEILSVPLGDPFATEIVAVPTQGVERWLAQTLSQRLGTSSGRRDGVCAGVSFTSLRRLCAIAVADVLGLETHTDPWQPRRAVWPLLAVIDEAQGQDWAAVLWSYLGPRSERAVAGSTTVAEQSAEVEPPLVPGHPVRRGRRWSTAAHLAELFDGYASSRPEMVRCWLRGQDVNASGRPLPPELAWQAELWRRLRARLDSLSPAERTEEACDRLVATPSAVDLPERLSVFGVSRLAPEHRAVLSALAVHRDVHLWLPHPSPALWNRISGAIAARRAQSVSSSAPTLLTGPRATDPTAGLPVNPLLGYLGRDVRELQLTLAADTTASADVPESASTIASDVHLDAPRTGQATLLAMLQDDLADDTPVRPLAERPLLAVTDRSISLHASHGPDRQVEVLREVLVGLLADDPTLEPRDIVVMCPDIETFAPLISATFGLAGDENRSQHPGHRLRVRLADRSLRQLNPLLATLSRVLGLVDSRVEASTLLDLCAFAPVAAKFHFTDDDLERLHDLVTRSGARWGLDTDHRSRFGMGRFGQNTWAAALDRLLLGVTMDESGQHYLGTALPLDDVDSSDVDLVGRLAELLDRVRTLLAQADGVRPLPEWIRLCKQVIEQLTGVSRADSWQVSHAYAELGALAELADSDEPPELTWSDLKALLADTFRGRATRANFRTGTLTMCTLLPMRSVPHRVVCLLGVDDGVFPRHTSRDGDDILAAEPWIGDRDPRSEDRQLLLDAILAAKEHLVVIYAGADARTRAPRPPAVPIGALLDALDLTARTEDGSRVRDRIISTHPLQPFDSANFTGQLSVAGGAFSFDLGSLRGAVAAAGSRTVAPTSYGSEAFAVPPLPDVVALPDLVRFFSHPVKAFLRARAELILGREADEPPDQIPVGVAGLEAWAIGDRLLNLHLNGVELEQLRAAEWRRGYLPPQQLGSRALEPVLDNVRQIAETTLPLLVGGRSGADVQAHVGGRIVSGTLASIYGHQLVTVGYSWLGPKHRLQAWIELLALTVSHPDEPWQAVSVGRGRRSRLGPVAAGWAAKVLADLVDLYAVGLSEPLPLSPKAAAEYARLRSDGKSIANFSDKLEQVWSEDRDVAYENVFGAGVTLSELLQSPSRPDEERGSLAEPSRFGTLARRVWQPLLGCEVLE